MNDRAALHAVVAREQFGAVIHFAALKAVGESVAKPIVYYTNNIGGLLNLLWVMRAEGIRNIVFSSSATVYGSGTPPFREDSPTGAGITNPYGASLCNGRAGVGGGGGRVSGHGRARACVFLLACVA